MSADPLEELRARIEAAQQATERLARETAAAREEAAAAAGTEIHALAAAAQAVRALLPQDLWDQLCELVRGLLVLVRAILDRMIDALQEPSAPAPQVRDVPIR
jgi:hypothetical protein